MTDADEALHRRREPLTVGTRVRVVGRVVAGLSWFDDEGHTTNAGSGVVPIGATGRVIGVSKSAHPAGEGWSIVWDQAIDGYDAESRITPDQLDLIEKI